MEGIGPSSISRLLPAWSQVISRARRYGAKHQCYLSAWDYYVKSFPTYKDPQTTPNPYNAVILQTPTLGSPPAHRGQISGRSHIGTPRWRSKPTWPNNRSLQTYRKKSTSEIQHMSHYVHHWSHEQGGTTYSLASPIPSSSSGIGPPVHCKENSTSVDLRKGNLCGNDWGGGAGCRGDIKEI